MNITKMIKPISFFILLSLNLALTDSFFQKVQGQTINNQTLAQTNKNNQVNTNLKQGQTITFNNRTFNIAWIQWDQDNQQHLGISDFGAVNLFGFDLLDTENPLIQPLKWYGDNLRENFNLTAQFIAPYRYLDLTDLLLQNGLTFRIDQNNLIIEQANGNINDIITIDQESKKEILVNLDRAIPWQISENNQEAVIMLSGNIDQSLLDKFSQSSLNSPIQINENNLVDDPSEINDQSQEKPLLRLEKTDNLVKLIINKPANYGIKINSLENPYRLQIEVIPDPLKSYNILWHEAIRLRKQYIAIDSPDLTKTDYFPVAWLEIDLKSPQISLTPIHPYSDTIIGLEPLVITARNVLASAAINAGFFNRNNHYPLGAIRDNFNWLSSPILNRGVMGWDAKGNIKFDRLILEEHLTVNQNFSSPILFLNSGYVKAGISRYDQQWGSTYIPLTNNEVIITVVDDQITAKEQGELAGSGQFIIPDNGYLLIFRSYLSGANQLKIGDNINLKSFTNPKDFERFPYIIGGGPLLIKNNQIVLNGELEGFTEAFLTQKASRSAIALNSEGKLIIATTHSRIGGGGATLGQWAQILQRLGATDALNLDGGSSTSLYLGGQLIDRSPVTAARVNNGLGVFIRP